MKKYGFFSNLKFMWEMHWRFDRFFLLLLFIQVVLYISASILTLVLPKVVIDGLDQWSKSEHYLIAIITLVSLLATLKAGSKKTQVSLDERSWKFFFFVGYDSINIKRMSMDYGIYSSPNGKNAAQKALMSVSGYIFSSIVAFFMYLKDLLINLLGFFAYTAILSTLNPWIIVFLILTYLLNSGIAVLIEKIRHTLREKEAEIWRKRRYFSLQTSLVQYAKDIRIYSLSKWLKDLRLSLLQEELSFSDRQQRYTLLQQLLQGLLVFARDGVVYAYLLYCMFHDSNMTIGMLSVYLGAVAGFGDWLAELVDSVQGLAEANGYVIDYREFIDMDNRREKNIANLTLTPPHSIRMEHVSFIYPGSDQLVLDDICMEIKAGENLALVGVNGAGKTTLVKLLCGLLQPTSGEIYIDDVNVKELTREDYYRCFGVVFQEANIMPVSVAQNITFKQSISDDEKQKLKSVLEAADLIQTIQNLPMGVNTMMMKQFHQDGVDFSGGELQKLLLARALYKDSPILILDEPTAALDPVAENELYLKYYSLTHGKTSLYISHRLSSTRFCDRIAVLDGAKLVETGTHSQLLKQNGIYARMFSVSSKYYREEVVANV